MGTERITIKEIAKDTGLSLATISKYLNNKPISEKNREIINASISKMHYVPNLAARSMRSSNSRSILIIIFKLAGWAQFWGGLVGSMESTLRENNYSSVVITRFTTENENILNRLTTISRQFSGAMFVPNTADDSVIVDHLANNLHMPVVVLDQKLKNCDCDFVSTDNFRAAYDATRYLIRHGHTRIAAIGGSSRQYTASERKRGYEQALRDSSIPVNPQYFGTTCFTSPEESQAAFSRIMKLRTPPTAVISLNYFTTLGCINAISDADIRVPEDLSFLSFDEDVIFPAIYHGITAIEQDSSEIGKTAAEIMIARLNGDDSPHHMRLIPAHLIRRGSVQKIE